MFMHNKRLTYTVRVGAPESRLANLILEQFGGAVCHEANFQPGKLPGQQEFTNTYFNMSQGEGDMRGPWNQGEQWDFVEGRAKQTAAVGSASVKLSRAGMAIAKKVAARTMSDPASDPTTGAELGPGLAR